MDDREALLTRLEGLLPSQLRHLIVVLDAPAQHFSNSSHTMTVLDLLQWAEQEGRTPHLVSALEHMSSVATTEGEPPPPPAAVPPMNVQIGGPKDLAQQSISFNYGPQPDHRPSVLCRIARFFGIADNK